MRDLRFIAVHRGGSLIKEQHRQLISWACDCAEHLIPLIVYGEVERLKNCILVAKEWERGNASTGDARKASMVAIVLANEASDQISIAVARAVGHAVATAHMADRSLIAATYALKAIQLAGIPSKMKENGKMTSYLLKSENLCFLQETLRKKNKICLNMLCIKE